jgi:hypothetical protein
MEDRTSPEAFSGNHKIVSSRSNEQPDFGSRTKEAVTSDLQTSHNEKRYKCTVGKVQFNSSTGIGTPKVCFATVT